MRSAAVVLLAVACAGNAGAQSVVEGRVLTADSVAVVAAHVALVDSSGSIILDAVSDSSGEFRIPLARRVRPGLFYLTVSSLGYATVERRPIRVGQSETVVVSIHMAPTLIALQPVNVVARRRYRPDVSDEYQDRAYWIKRSGMGHVLEYDKLQKLSGMNMVRALAMAPGVRFETVNGVDVLRMRDNCTPVVYLDRLRLGFGDASHIQATDLEGIEVYRGVAEVPPEYAMGAGGCGVILAWSNRRVDGARAFSWKRVGIFGGLVGLAFFILN